MMSNTAADSMDIELKKRWFKRRSKVLDAQFKARHSLDIRNEIDSACRLVGLLYVAFGAMDALLINDLLPFVLIWRVIVAIVYVGGIVLQLRRGVDTRLIELQCSLGIFFGFATWLLITSQSTDITGAMYYAAFGLVFMLVANLFYNLSFGFAILSSGLITLTFLCWSILFIKDISYNICFGSLYVLSFILTAFLNFKYNRERYRVYLNECRADARQREVLLRGEELFRLSTTDTLTGLSNRRAIDGVLESLWHESTAVGQTFGVVLIDVDFFKSYNDRYGHHQGDVCLTAIGQAMREVAVRHGYAIGRFGGEEFAAMFPAKTADEVTVLAEEIRKSVELLGIIHAARRDHLSIVTVSVGAMFSADVAGDKPERTITAADLALYAAKEHRNRCRFFDQGMLNADADDEAMAEVLRSAIDNKNIAVAFQPIVDISTGKIWAAEALMRLKDCQGRTISPERFIPLAERTNAILKLGEWILREACNLLADEPSLAVVSVNISAKQIDNPGFVHTVEAIVKETGITPSRLALEITEGGQISGNPKVAKLMDRLSAIGVRVWLDDFGTGFAGLTCLSELRFDMVKIDRFFVESCDTPRGAKLLKNIIDLVGTCAQRIIVEGVEYARQVELVASFGVDLFQGYHLGRPMPRQELVIRLRDEYTALDIN